MHILCNKVGRGKGSLKIHRASCYGFLFEEIFVRYGVPREIVIDGGAQFTGIGLRHFSRNTRFSIESLLLTTSQANGQVESTNKVLENILTKTVANHFRDWDDRLPEALWAYRTNW
jgi:hypothetical protein